MYFVALQGFICIHIKLCEYLVINKIYGVLHLTVCQDVHYNSYMREAKDRLSLRVPKDFKQRLRIASVKAERELTDIAVEAINLWLIEFDKKEAQKK